MEQKAEEPLFLPESEVKQQAGRRHDEDVGQQELKAAVGPGGQQLQEAETEGPVVVAAAAAAMTAF